MIRIAGSCATAALLVLSVPALAAAERGLPDRLTSGGYLLQVLLSLSVVLVLVVGLLLVLRRLQGRLLRSTAGLPALRVVASLNVGGRERVLVLQAGEQQLLLGVAPGSVQLLHAFEQPLQAAGERPLVKNAGGFAAILSGLTQRRGALP
jgi:flagellar protein FliO/FliZ